MCLGAAIALRVAFLAIDCAIDTFTTGLGELFTPTSASYGLEVYVPALENPYSAAETQQAFGFTESCRHVLRLAILMVVPSKKRRGSEGCTAAPGEGSVR